MWDWNGRLVLPPGAESAPEITDRSDLHLVCMHHVGVYFMGVHLVGMHLIGVNLVGLYMDSNHVVVEMSQNQMVTIGNWKFQIGFWGNLPDPPP